MLTIEQAKTTRKTLHRQVRRETPWGIADFMTTFGPGVTSYATPSHGGFFVDDLDAMPEILRKRSNSYCGFHWFEEDCESALVVVAHPDLFTPDERAHALQSMKAFYPDQYAAYLVTDHFRTHGVGDVVTA
jgi:hypothetical protein